MQRERSPEPTTISEILRGAHWEILCLLREMQQILQTPTAIYELYPRIKVAFEIHDEAEAEVIYPLVRGWSPEIARVGEEDHARLRERLQVLDRLPWRREQIASAQWKLDFLSLHDQLVRHFDWEQRTLLPLLEKHLDSQGRGEVAAAYCHALARDFEKYFEERA